MLEVILQGILLGLLLSVMVGPVFFVLLETSIVKGIRAALILDSGVLFSDLVYVYIAYTFYQEAAALMDGSEYFRIFGGLVFIIFGLFNIFKKMPGDNTGKNVLPEFSHSFFNSVKLVSKGFVLNAVNPGVIFYWLTIISVGTGASEVSTGDSSQVPYAYVIAILVTFFSIDVLKIIGAKKLKPLLTPKMLQIVNMITGVILCAAGIVYILNGILSSVK